ncbi:AAA family ATPase [Chloroflexota bacterium]
MAIEQSPPVPNGGRTIAVTGKGGSGKTMLTALMTGLLARNKDLKILAIDADSSISLPYALGVSINKTVADIRQGIIEDPKAKAAMDDKPIRMVMEEILEDGQGFRLLTMGRPEGPGCFCATNDLLRYGIDNLSKRFDITLIDCEAGPEQVNRRVVNGVDILVIVTDTSVRGMHAASSIADVVKNDRDIKVSQAGLVINKSKGKDDLIVEMAQKQNLDVLGSVPDDETLAEYDSLGKPIVNLPDTSPSVHAVQQILQKLTLL